MCHIDEKSFSYRKCGEFRFFQFTLGNIVNYEIWLSEPPGKHLAYISLFFDWHE